LILHGFFRRDYYEKDYNQIAVMLGFGLACKRQKTANVGDVGVFPWPTLYIGDPYALLSTNDVILSGRRQTSVSGPCSGQWASQSVKSEPELVGVGRYGPRAIQSLRRRSTTGLTSIVGRRFNAIAFLTKRTERQHIEYGTGKP